MTERRFVLEPLHEIAPELVLAKGGPTVSELLKNLSALRIRPVGNSPEECEEAATALNRLMPTLTEVSIWDATSRGRCRLAPPSFFAARQRDAKHGLKMWP